MLGFPCNQFGGQEPGTAEEIAAVLLDVVRRVVPDVREDRGQRSGPHPIYEELTAVADAEGHDGDIRWNFEKFLVDPQGGVTRFSPMVAPDDPQLVAAIEAALPA